MKVEAWLVMKAKRSAWANYPHTSPYQGQPLIEGAKVVKCSINKPTVEADSIAFKIEIDVDESWFLEGTATIKATIPPQPAAAAEIQATVVMPVKGRAQSAAAKAIKP